MRQTRVLVADDEPSVNRFIATFLREEGYLVVSATDGKQALEVMEETSPDLIALDIKMPKLDGFEVCRLIRERSQVPIIMVSVIAGEKEKVKCLRLGADDYIVKPFGIDEFIARVEAVLRRNKPVETPPSLPLDIIAGWSYLLKKSVSDVKALSRAIEGAVADVVVVDPQIVKGTRLDPEGFLARLTPRQNEILSLIAQGFTNAAIGERLVLSVKSVENQINLMYKRLDFDRTDSSVHARVYAVLSYLQAQFTPGGN